MIPVLCVLQIPLIFSVDSEKFLSYTEYVIMDSDGDWKPDHIRLFLCLFKENDL